MNKYIVKNCPAYDLWKPTHSCVSNYSKCVCERNADCLIKQIIEKCREVQCPCELEGFDCWECGENRRKTFADGILQLFEIEECDNDSNN